MYIFSSGEIKAILTERLYDQATPLSLQLLLRLFHSQASWSNPSTLLLPEHQSAKPFTAALRSIHINSSDHSFYIQNWWPNMLLKLCSLGGVSHHCLPVTIQWDCGVQRSWLKHSTLDSTAVAQGVWQAASQRWVPLRNSSVRESGRYTIVMDMTVLNVI